MDELKKILASAKGFWKKQSKKQKTIYLSVLGGVVASAIIIAIVMNIDTYTLIYTGSDSAESSQIVTTLQEMSIPVRVENNGGISVPKKKQAEVAMKLATAGYPKDRENYRLFKDNVSLTTTEFEKNQYARFQTEENLRASIKTIPGVKDASVNIALADSDQFVLASEKVDTKASAKVDMLAGYELAPQQVAGIESLISYAVVGLTTDNVSVVDNSGKLLSGGTDTEDGENKLRLTYEKQVEDSMKQKVVDILKGPFGSDGVSVAVSVTLDYDKLISEEMTYMPSVGDKGMLSHEDTNDVTETGQTQGGVTGVEANAEVPTYPDVAPGDSSNYSQKEYSADYLVSYIKTQKERNGATKKLATVSVMINRETMTDTEIESVKEIAAAAVGVDTENVYVKNMRFKDTQGLQITPQLDTKMILVVGGAALLFIIILIVFISLLARNHRRKRDLMDMVAAGDAQIGDINQYFGKVEAPKHDTSVAKLEVTETKDMALKREIQTFSKDNPDIAAQLLRTWLKGDDDDGFY